MGKLLLLACASLSLVAVVPAYLPLVDFPQHVALHAIWDHIGDPAYNLGGRFRVTLATPYALPHLLAHAASFVLGPEGGLRFVLVLSLAAFPLGALAMFRAFGRPPELALAAAPAALSFVYWFGFTSYVMALPLVLAGIGCVRRCALQGRMRDFVLLAVLALITVATHGFAFLLLLLLGAAAALATTRSMRQLLPIAAALLPAAAWSAVWAVSFGSEPHPEPVPTAYGFFCDRLRFGLGTILGTHSLELRTVCVAVALVTVFAVALWFARGNAARDPGRRALGAVALVAIAASLLCPEVLMNTWGLWERIPPLAFVALAGAVPWPSSERVRGGLASALCLVALLAAGGAIAQGVAFSGQAQGIRELAADLPRGARIFWSACGDEFPAPRATPAYKHFGAYVQAARGGDLSYSFAHFPHMVVRYRGEALPEMFDRSIYDYAVLKLGPRCPPLEELRKLGPVSVRGSYVALRSTAVTPELGAALAPERSRVVRTAERR